MHRAVPSVVEPALGALDGGRAVSPFFLQPVVAVPIYCSAISAPLPVQLVPRCPSPLLVLSSSVKVFVRRVAHTITPTPSSLIMGGELGLLR